MKILFVVIWIVCGFFAYGITYGYFQNKYSTFAGKDRIFDTILALFFGMLGILGLILAYYLSGCCEYGLKWIDKK